MQGTGRLGNTHFHLPKHVVFIRKHGTQVEVYPCHQCPCQPPTRHSDPNCFACGGTGRLYLPTLHYGTTLLSTHERSARTLDDPGMLLQGAVRATILPGVRFALQDLVRFLDMRDTFADEVLTRGTDDTLRFTGSVEIESVVTRRAVFAPERDYVLTPPATITWLPDGDCPPVGGQYAVRYSANVDYLVVPDDPSIRIEQRIPQSQVVTLRRLDKLTESDVGYGGLPLA
jgi:hypothetical protein